MWTVDGRGRPTLHFISNNAGHAAPHGRRTGKKVTCTYRSQHRFCESCNSNQPLREIGIRLNRNFNVAFLLMRSRKSCRGDALLIRCKIIFYSWLHPRTSLNASQCHGKYTRIKFSHLRQRPNKVSSGPPRVAVQT